MNGSSSHSQDHKYVPEEVKNFKDLNENALDITDRKNHNKTILWFELRDKNQKLRARPLLGITLTVLLIAQNICIFGFFVYAYTKGDLIEYSTVISVVATATLAETAALVHTMVKWIFSDMEYPTR